MTDDEEGQGLTEQDRRGIAAIRRELDAEFTPAEPVARPPRRWSTAVVALAFVAGALSTGAGVWFALLTSRPGRQAAVPGRPDVESTPTLPPAALPGGAAATPPAPADGDPPAGTREDVDPAALTPAARTRRDVRAATLAWLDAQRRADLDAQMRFYPSRVPVFYHARDVERRVVRAEKARGLGSAPAVELGAGEPVVDVEVPDARARARFRKRSVVHPPHVRRRGEVLQELRWVKAADGWKIVGEREVEVLSPRSGDPNAARRPLASPQGP
jgi:hypothetical protein